MDTPTKNHDNKNRITLFSTTTTTTRMQYIDKLMTYRFELFEGKFIVHFHLRKMASS